MILCTAVGLLADQATKGRVLATMLEGEVRPVFGDVLQITLTFNPGAIFSLNPGTWIPGFSSNAFFIVLALIGIVVMAVVYARLPDSQSRLTHWGLAVVMPGAAGNCLDRVQGLPGVVDFLWMDLGFPPFHPWPIFNLADVFIPVGVGLVVLDLFRSEAPRKHA